MIKGKRKRKTQGDNANNYSRGRIPSRGVRQNRFEFTNTHADVIFVFYGYNESFAGAAGVEKFKHDLARFIKHTRALYNF